MRGYLPQSLTLPQSLRYLPKSLTNPLSLCSTIYETGNPPSAQLCVHASIARAGKRERVREGDTESGGWAAHLVRGRLAVVMICSPQPLPRTFWARSKSTASAHALLLLLPATTHTPHLQTRHYACVYLCACVHTLVLVGIIALRDREKGGRGSERGRGEAGCAREREKHPHVAQHIFEAAG